VTLPFNSGQASELPSIESMASRNLWPLWVGPLVAFAWQGVVGCEHLNFGCFVHSQAAVLMAKLQGQALFDIGIDRF
jgi:hypothetical protein